ncbi:hypothetical protein [Krasilnikovia sp. MM14-A1004]|uniref:hypothetical protein n=1 Tax=Krasilnikovia sp. MM14-A1004 TaxID=3373541 RepID=UPI00399C9922
MSDIETLPLFGEPDRPNLPAPPKVTEVRWASYHPTNRVQCTHCVQIVHARHGHGRLDIRTATRRRTSHDGELLLCALHADAKHTADVAAGLVPAPKRPARRRR